MMSRMPRNPAAKGSRPPELRALPDPRIVPSAGRSQAGTGGGQMRSSSAILPAEPQHATVAVTKPPGALARRAYGGAHDGQESRRRHGNAGAKATRVTNGRPWAQIGRRFAWRRHLLLWGQALNEELR
jgi:hypothetical protein